MSKHLHDLPENLTIYRGNLKLPIDAGPDVHLKVREAFLQSLRRWRRKNHYIVEVYARTHATDALNAHYDIVAYTDAPHDMFHATMIELWERAGGRQRNKNARGLSLVRVEDWELTRWLHYLVKLPKPVVAGATLINTHIGKETVKPPSPKLLRCRKLSGLDMSWHTRSSKSSPGFWRTPINTQIGKETFTTYIKTTPDAIWSTLISEWFPPEDMEEIHLERAMMGLKPIRQRDPEPIPQPYIPGDDPNRDRIKFSAELPTDPNHAIGINIYAQRWGVSGDYMQSIIRSISGAVCLDGRINELTKCHVYGAWYMQTS